MTPRVLVVEACSEIYGSRSQQARVLVAGIGLPEGDVYPSQAGWRSAEVSVRCGCFRPLVQYHFRNGTSMPRSVPTRSLNFERLLPEEW